MTLPPHSEADAPVPFLAVGWENACERTQTPCDRIGPVRRCDPSCTAREAPGGGPAVRRAFEFRALLRQGTAAGHD